ncbi:hypothetical protein ARMGADRAFT_1039239 [Armillaria gallica]|uniref:Uncharacterized protein n=1 Tax=Armillaria gallica TaxID=47427 RepID=A0A2H3D221_ARMGA|nr:hypothetical protein ARMGADRAFT_1039239 [Armillaria gallica]
MQVCRGANDVPDHDISFDLVSFGLMGHGSIKMETSKLRKLTTYEPGTSLGFGANAPILSLHNRRDENLRDFLVNVGPNKFRRACYPFISPRPVTSRLVTTGLTVDGYHSAISVPPQSRPLKRLQNVASSCLLVNVPNSLSRRGSSTTALDRTCISFGSARIFSISCLGSQRYLYFRYPVVEGRIQSDKKEKAAARLFFSFVVVSSSTLISLSLIKREKYNAIMLAHRKLGPVTGPTVSTSTCRQNVTPSREVYCTSQIVSGEEMVYNFEFFTSPDIQSARVRCRAQKWREEHTPFPRSSPSAMFQSPLPSQLELPKTGAW